MFPVKAEGEREQLLGANVQSSRIGWNCTGPGVELRDDG